MLELTLSVPAVALGIAPQVLFRVLARGRVYEVADAPFTEVALVLGARLLAPNLPTTLLLHRLEAARALLVHGKAQRLLLSGLGRESGQDEVGTMRRWLLERGTAEDRLILDRDSARTLESFLRARHVFGLTRVAVVTNPFHLPRALFLARRCGLSAVGIAARPGLTVSMRTMLKNHARESVACLRAVWDVGAHAR